MTTKEPKQPDILVDESLILTDITGLKIELHSTIRSVNELCGLAIQLRKEILNPNGSDKRENKGVG